MAIKHAISRKSYWRMSTDTRHALRDAQQVAGATRTTFAQSNSGATLLRFEEPPSADPHASTTAQ